MAQTLFGRRNKSTVAEILKSIKEAKTKKDRIKILQENKNNLGLISIIRMQFDDRLKFALPEGIPENLKLNKAESGQGEVELSSEYRKFYLFLEGASKMKQFKREGLFLGILESLDKDEAEVLIAVKDKKLDFGLTRKLIDEAFPGLIPVSNKVEGNEKEGTQKAGSSSGS